jgi:hypothetical protein
MIHGLTSTARYIYHYSPFAKVILNNRTLKFGMYTKTNDPKESKDWMFEVGSNEGVDVGCYNMDELGSWFSRELKAKTRLACFAMDAEPLTGTHFIDIFNRGFCKPKMWAQYADRHRGVCLVFDFSKIERSGAGAVQRRVSCFRWT